MIRAAIITAAVAFATPALADLPVPHVFSNGVG